MSEYQLYQGDCLEIMKQIPDKSIYDSTERYPTSVLTFSTDKQKSALHPTQKPVELCKWLIKTYTNENMTVLDNCMGSGSTGEACLRTNRNFIGIEKEEKYFNIAKERLERMEGELNGK